MRNMLMVILTLGGAAQPRVLQADAVPFDSPRWKIEARESERLQHLGRDALRLKGGAATLTDSDFTDGVIEFDIAFGPERGFAGAFWRMQGPGDFEHFYIRPHQSGHPDANQYTPVFNGVAGWQLYYGEQYAVPATYRYDEWIPVRIAVAGDRADVSIGGSHPAELHVDLKRTRAAGHVGLVVSDFAPAYYSNFRYQPGNPPLGAAAVPIPPAEPRTVMLWRVSPSFHESALDSAMKSLPPADAAMWTSLQCEVNGLANLARVQGISPEANCAVARVRVVSDRARTVRMRFGYSDRATVFVNGTPMYSGDNTYMSRDYRYLGTIGWFDAVHVPLRSGANDIDVAVAESFGGWGVMARFEETEGLRIEPAP